MVISCRIYYNIYIYIDMYIYNGSVYNKYITYLYNISFKCTIMISSYPLYFASTCNRQGSSN